MLPYHSTFPYTVQQTHQGYDVCIVLGSPSNTDGSLSRIQKQRNGSSKFTLYQKREYSKDTNRGEQVANCFIEAEVMKDYPIAQNVPEKDILLEKYAKNTYENLKYAADLCNKHHFSKIIIVTSGFHIRRAGFFAQKFLRFHLICPYQKKKIKDILYRNLRMWNTLYYVMEIKIARRMPGYFLKYTIVLHVLHLIHCLLYVNLHTMYANAPDH